MKLHFVSYTVFCGTKQNVGQPFFFKKESPLEGKNFIKRVSQIKIPKGSSRNNRERHSKEH